MPKKTGQKTPSTAVWWIRRDLRLEDNQALQAALENAGRVLPVFVIDPYLVQSSRMGQERLKFLWGGLRLLQRELRERGADLIIRRGDPIKVVPALVNESAASTVYAEEDFSPYARRRDRTVAEQVPLSLKPGLVIAHPEAISKADGGPYQIYSYYRKKWRKRLYPIPRDDVWDAPGRIKIPQGIPSDSIPETEFPLTEYFPPGHESAQDRLEMFTSGKDPAIYSYQEGRDRPDLQGTSRLSPYFHFGMLSARQALVEAQAAADQAGGEKQQKSVDTWVDELIWRDFYVSILYHFPHVVEGSFRENTQHISWQNDREDFQRWKEGKTGYPLVDAGMRQLLEMNWIHNRLRMVVASFLVKDLLIDWRWGETWFMKNLLDADLAANNGGWQWVAGTGTDAAPYFRIFNPVSQSQKHDPQGEYIKRFVPELQVVSPQYIHEPWTMSASVQVECGCVIGKDYPAPIIDHGLARERTLSVYRDAREANQSIN